ncbi:ATP-binding protein [Sediminibacillus massiliensis]|uniref:ATP-binding protein n=1 Tax=Sediminibacillus massiliensis TaxID=1926277 RepID=UPI000988545C|nr:ATP-binding protein [Sediminibacillus massiliensis]
MEDFASYIKESKAICRDLYQMDPGEIPYLRVGLTREQLSNKKHKFAKVLTISKHFMQKLIHFMEGTPVLVVTTDNDGYVLDVYGDPEIKEMIDSLGITIGVKFDERDVGTNSVSMALKSKQPFAVVGSDHFHHFLSSVACYSAPFSYSVGGNLAGTVSVMTLIDYASQFYVGLLSSAVDSIEREIHLQEQNHQLHLLNDVLVDSTPLGIIRTDVCGNIVESNSSAEEITGVDKNEMVKLGLERMPLIGNYIREVLKKGEKIENMELFCKEVTKNILLDVFPLFDGPGNMVGAFAQFRDMTNFHELQQQVIEAEKLSAIGKLGTGLAHEIRNPLTSIIGLTELLKQNNHQNKYLEIITSELERMKGLLNQFVSLGKPTKIELENCNLDELIEDTVELMKSNAKLQNVEIEYRSFSTDMNIYIDQPKIKQVLINFIKNGFEAMPDGGKVTVKLEHDPDKKEVHIAIRDRGKGMTEQEVNSLGTPFFTTKESGLGLGLPICFDIVKSHHGHIKIDSQKDNGTIVHLYLPQYQ